MKGGDEKITKTFLIIEQLRVLVTEKGQYCFDHHQSIFKIWFGSNLDSIE